MMVLQLPDTPQILLYDWRWNTNLNLIEVFKMLAFIHFRVNGKRFEKWTFPIVSYRESGRAMVRIGSISETATVILARPKYPWQD